MVRDFDEHKTATDTGLLQQHVLYGQMGMLTLFYLTSSIQLNDIRQVQSWVLM